MIIKSRVLVNYGMNVSWCGFLMQDAAIRPFVSVCVRRFRISWKVLWLNRMHGTRYRMQDGRTARGADPTRRLSIADFAYIYGFHGASMAGGVGQRLSNPLKTKNKFLTETGMAAGGDGRFGRDMF